MIAPVITIFVRHGEDCKYSADEFSKRCQCRKHLRWTHKGKQHRRKAGTSSWAEAELVKRNLEDQLAGRTETHRDSGQDIQEAISKFLEDKTVRGVSAGVLGKYTRELARLRSHAERLGVYTVQGLSRELLTGFCATWPSLYPSSTTRAVARKRLIGYLRFCYEAQWLPRVPVVPTFKIDEPETQPLTPGEYERLLDAVYATVDNKQTDRFVVKVHAFIQCMRWSGLAIRDTATLPVAALQLDARKDLYRITTKRTKTGTPVSIPIPREVAEELLAAARVNDNPLYFFWNGKGDGETAAKTWSTHWIAPCFKQAKIHSDGFMVSHRLRDTFAVRLLEDGVPMEEVSRLLGHTSISVTEKHYAKWSPGRQDRVDDLVSGTWKSKPKPKLVRIA